MKRIISILLVVIVCITCIGCENSKVQKNDVEPEVSQMKSICELAALECYYHNVAKYNEKDASGVLWWKKDRKFWIEYSGVVTVGIDVSQVEIEVEENIVNITIPSAKILGCKVDESTLTEDSFIVAKDSAKVEAEHETEAFREAQTKMEQAASEDTALLSRAQQRAQKLLQEYIKNIGECVGKEYQIKWIYLDDNNSKDTTE